MTEVTQRGLRFWRCCQRWSLSLGGQMTALMILLLRIVWGMWRWRDMTYGDTTGYYYLTMAGPIHGPQALVFSPLYLTFYGSFTHWFQDAFVATILHRIVILVMLSSSLLLLARRLLPKAVAWLVAAWWLVLPIDWNALYEVHLFGFIPLALGCWLVGGRRHRLSLTLGLTLVWTGALLVRNEYALSVALLAVCCVVREWFLWRRSATGSAGRLVSRIFLVALPSLLVLAMSAVVWHKYWHGWGTLQASFHDRHTLNMAQVYPFSYQQRHPEWSKDPWTQGGELMKEKFGKPRITFSEAFKRNPGAIWEHVLWHAHLTPAGLQWGLFNGHSGADSPDFTPPRQQPVKAGVLSALMLAVLGAGTFCLWQRRSRLKRLFKSRRVWSWLALVCLLPPCAVAIITQRPRPSYILPLNFFLMALAGLCLYAVLRRLKWWRCFQGALPLFMVVIIAAAAPEKKTAQMYEGQPLLNMYEHLKPFSDYLQRKKTFASREFTYDLHNLLNYTVEPPANLTLGDPIEQSAASFQEALETHRVGTLYLNATDLGNQGVRDWLDSDDAKKWTILENHDRGPDLWMLLYRALPAKDQKPKEQAPKA